MTDTTDIKALREIAFNANMAITRLSANGEECLYAIGEDNQIDKDVELSNQFHKAFNPIVVIYLLDQLEVERQRADKAENSELEQRLANAEHQLYMKDLAIHNVRAQRKAQFKKRKAVEEEIAALKGKLANPVVLSDCSFEAVSHMAHWYSKGECVAWVSGAEHVKKQILEAGFTVKGE